MLEAIKHNMESIDGIAIYPVLSLVIFFTFFLGLGIWVFFYKKETINELSQIPLKEDNS